MAGISTVLTQLDASISKKRVQMFALLLGFGLGFMFLALCIQQVLTPEGVPPIGRDFSAFWSAGQLFWQDRALEVFDGAVMGALQASVSDVTGTLYWHYPPTYLAAITPFGLFSYPVSLALFSGLSMIAWICAVRLVRPDVGFMRNVALFFAPAFWMCFAQGQNGTFVALFLIAGLVFRERQRTTLAAICFAALVIKPHFGVLIPVILIAQNDWSLFVKTGVLSIIFTGVATAIVGPAYWPAFLDNFGLLRAALQTGELTHHQISGFAFGQALGLPPVVRSVLQGATALASIYACWAIWRQSARFELRVSVFLIGSVLISPYAFHYDGVMLVIVLYLLFNHGLKYGAVSGEKVLYTMTWMAPLGLLWSQSVSAALYFYPLYLGLLGLTWIKFRAEIHTKSL